MAFPPTAGQIRGLSSAWLLDLDLGGDIRRYSSRPVTVTTEAGDLLAYDGGLTLGDVEIGETLDRVGVRIEDGRQSWARYRAQGGQLAMRRAVLRLWWPGLTLEGSLLVLEGLTSGLTISPPGAPGEFRASVRGDLLDSSSPSPGAQAVIDEDTFSHTLGSIEIDNAARGSIYPIIVGYPGTGDPVDDETSPSAVVEVKLAQISGSHTTTELVICEGTVDASTVHVWDLDSEQGIATTLNRHGDMDITVDSDLLGQTYSYASFNSVPGNTEPEFTSGHTYAVSFRNAASYGGGLLNRERTGPLRGLGEVIRYCLEASGVEVDSARQESERGNLDTYKIDGLIAGADRGRIDLARWVNDELTKMFPIRRMRSGNGVWYRFWNLKATHADAIERLDADSGQVRRTSGLARAEGLHNRFTINFAQSRTGSGRRLILSADPERYVPFLGVDSRVLGSTLCKASRELYGELEAPALNPSFVWSRTTAAGILEYQALRDALPTERVSYEGQNLEYLEPGDIVLINDSSLYLTDRVALVDTLRIGGSPTGLTLLLLPRYDVLTS